MTLPHWALHLPPIYYSILLAALILVNSIITFIQWIVSFIQRKRIEKRDEEREENRRLEEEAREEARKIEMAEYREQEDARQEELAKNLIISQELVETHAQLLRKDLEEVKRELRENTQVNVEALEKANGFNEKIAQVVELAATIPVVQQVEIVQPDNHPVPVREVEG